MKVSGVGSSKGPSDTKKKKEVGSGGFASALREASESESVQGVRETSGVGGVESLLAAQEVDSATDRPARRQARERGEQLLDHLDRLRVALLDGRMPKDQLVRMAQQIRERRAHVSDPQLEELLSEIELRAEVELAKLSRR